MRLGSEESETVSVADPSPPVRLSVPEVLLERVSEDSAVSDCDVERDPRGRDRVGAKVPLSSINETVTLLVAVAVTEPYSVSVWVTVFPDTVSDKVSVAELKGALLVIV